MSEPAYPSLDQGGKSEFEGLASGGQGGSFELHFTSGGDAGQQLAEEEQQQPYRTFKGEQQLSARTSSEEISLLEKGRPTSPSTKGKVRSRRVAAQHGGVCRMYNIYIWLIVPVLRLACTGLRCVKLAEQDSYKDPDDK